MIKQVLIIINKFITVLGRTDGLTGLGFKTLSAYINEMLTLEDFASGKGR